LRQAPLTAGETRTRLRAIGLFCLALALFSALDACAKYASRSVPAMEVVWIRFFGQALLAVVFLRPWRSPALYGSKRPVLQLVRSVLLFSSTILNFLALKHLQLAETITITFASAFVVAGLAVPLLGEWIGPRRWAAICVGFIGVLIVARPGPEGIQPAILFSIASMFCYSGYFLTTRMLASSDSAEGMLLYPALAALVLLAPFSLPDAVLPPSPGVAVALALTGVCGAAGHWCLIHAHRLTSAGVLSPFIYLQIVWMIALGYVVFGDVPHELTLVGAAIVIASGLYILYRERVHGDR